MIATLEKDIIKLWNEGMMPEDIAGKLNCEEDDVVDTIECEQNYKEGKNVFD